MEKPFGRFTLPPLHFSFHKKSSCPATGRENSLAFSRQTGEFVYGEFIVKEEMKTIIPGPFLSCKRVVDVVPWTVGRSS
jgi:hypothetical protein